MAIISNEQAFIRHIGQRYKGKVYKIERADSPTYHNLIVRVEFHIPVSEADELEMFRRINQVIEVIAEG